MCGGVRERIRRDLVVAEQRAATEMTLSCLDRHLKDPEAVDELEGTGGGEVDEARQVNILGAGGSFFRRSRVRRTEGSVRMDLAQIGSDLFR